MSPVTWAGAIRQPLRGQSIQAADARAPKGTRATRPTTFFILLGVARSAHGIVVGPNTVWEHTALNNVVQADSNCKVREDLASRFSNISCSAYNKVRQMPGTILVFGSYHKSGTVLAQRLITVISAQKPQLVVHAIVNRSDDIFFSDPIINFYQEPNLNVIFALPSYRLVHMIRDPVRLVASAYRYHSTSKEPWLTVPMSFYLSEAGSNVPGLISHGTKAKRALQTVMDHAHEFGSHRLSTTMTRFVQKNRSISDLYHELPEEDGALVEAYRSLESLQHMAENFQITASDSNVLQVRMERIEEDYDSTMRCILEFISHARHVDVDQLVAQLRKHDLARLPSTARGIHATSGQYDNTRIHVQLRRVPHVRQAVQALRMRAVRSC